MKPIFPEGASRHYFMSQLEISTGEDGPPILFKKKNNNNNNPFILWDF